MSHPLLGSTEPPGPSTTHPTGAGRCRPAAWCHSQPCASSHPHPCRHSQQPAGAPRPASWRRTGSPPTAMSSSDRPGEPRGEAEGQLLPPRTLHPGCLPRVLTSLLANPIQSGARRLLMAWVGDGGQGGIEGLAQQQGLVPPQRLLQDSVSAVVVKEGAGGRGGVRRPRGAQGWVWGSKETWSEEGSPHCPSPTELGHPHSSAMHGTCAPGCRGHVPRACSMARCHPNLEDAHQMHITMELTGPG